LCDPGTPHVIAALSVIHRYSGDLSVTLFLAKSPEWKDVAFEMKVDGTATTAGANRAVDGKTYWFSVTRSNGNGGVAVRSPAGEWLCKYLFENGKEITAEKMTGNDENIAKFRTVSTEFAAVCIAGSS
jgi:hypothetical protein